MLINLRNALMTGKRLPYDAEVEFLESTGTQYIDTGVLASQNIKIEARFYRAISPSQFAYGVRSGSTTISCATGTGTSVANTGYARWGDSAYAAVIPNTEVVVVQDKDGVTVNGTHYNYTSAQLVVSQSGYTIALFAAKNSATTVTANLSGKFWYCKIWDNGTLVRDFIPVRRGTVGYLYDRVSGKLFGNAGTGDFVLGPDVVPVEYLQSTGTEWQWINALDSALDANSFEMSVAMLTDNSARRIFFGSGPSSSQYLEVTAATSWGSNSVSLAVCQIGAATTISADTNRVLQINGATVGYGLNLIGSTAPDFPLCLFKTRGYTGYRCAVRCFYFKAWQNGVPIRSFRPVRVGSGSTWEGAMIDTLTRRIYRNAGTGAFSYGNDLRYPIPAE